MGIAAPAVLMLVNETLSRRARVHFRSDLEEMYLVNMNLNQDKEMLAKELGKSLGTGREKVHDGVTYKRLVELTIGFFNTEASVQEKLGHKNRELEELKTMG